MAGSLEGDLSRRQFLRYASGSAAVAVVFGLEAACSNIPNPFAQSTPTPETPVAPPPTETPISAPTKAPTRQVAPIFTATPEPSPTPSAEANLAADAKTILTTRSINLNGKFVSFDEIMTPKGYKYKAIPTPGKIGLVTRIGGAETFEYPFTDTDLQKLVNLGKPFDPLPEGTEVPIPVTLKITKGDNYLEEWLFHSRQEYYNFSSLTKKLFTLMDINTPDANYVAIEVQH